MAQPILSIEEIRQDAKVVAKNIVSSGLDKERANFERITKDEIWRNLLTVDGNSTFLSNPKKALLGGLANIADGNYKAYQALVAEIQEDRATRKAKVVRILGMSSTLTQGNVYEVQAIVGNAITIPVNREACELTSYRHFVSLSVYNKISEFINSVVVHKGEMFIEELKRKSLDLVVESRRNMLARIFRTIAGKNNNLDFGLGFAQDLISSTEQPYGKFASSIILQVVGKRVGNKTEPQDLRTDDTIHGYDMRTGITYENVKVTSDETGYYFVPNGGVKKYIKGSVVLFKPKKFSEMENAALKLFRKYRNIFKDALISALSIQAV